MQASQKLVYLVTIHETMTSISSPILFQSHIYFCICLIFTTMTESIYYTSLSFPVHLQLICAIWFASFSSMASWLYCTLILVPKRCLCCLLVCNNAWPYIAQLWMRNTTNWSWYHWWSKYEDNDTNLPNGRLSKLLVGMWSMTETLCYHDTTWYHSCHDLFHGIPKFQIQ